MIERLICDQCFYHVNIFQETILRDSVQLNIDQRIIYDILYQVIDADNDELYFLNDFKKAEKTFVINLTLSKV